MTSFQTARHSTVRRSRLHAENATATEQLKADLQIAAAERQIRFARLHEKVAECVSETYSRLSNFLIAVAKYTAVFESPGMGSKEERRLAMAESLRELDEYFRMHKLYLPKSLADRIKTFIDKLFKISTDFMYDVEMPGDQKQPTQNAWLNVEAEMQTSAKPLFEGLEDEFRSLLGVPTSTTTTSGMPLKEPLHSTSSPGQ